MRTYKWASVIDVPELELELIQTHLTQKPLLWVEVGACGEQSRPVMLPALYSMFAVFLGGFRHSHIGACKIQANSPRL
jgi:hypothetical protein